MYFSFLNSNISSMNFSLKFLSTSILNRFLATGIQTMKNVLKPPNIRGVVVLNKDTIKKSIDIPCLSIKKESLNSILNIIKQYFLKIEKFKPVQPASEENIDIYMSPEVIRDWSSFPEEIQSALEKLQITKDNFRIVKDFELKYDNFTADDLLKAILPVEKEGMSSFTKVGHIVHVNLREHLLPFKNVIGEILFDKISGCQSVVNKVNIIDNTYRNFSMEVLKGIDNMLTTVKENHCSFKFDFSQVYWNSRLCTEHERIVNMLNKNDVLFDVFAGVGPFSVPIAKKKCFVYANDLNPESYKWLEFNAKSNKISKEYFKSFNKDGKDFIKNEIKEFLPSHIKNDQNIFITMNLPAMAVEFLTHFEGLFQYNELPDFKNPPHIYVYCFVKGDNYLELAKNVVLNSFTCDISQNIVDIFKVRTVSSLKEMMRVTIKLDKDILIGTCRKRKLEAILNSDNKISCLSDDNGQKQEKS
ncbi:unnamed protein product [Psylliodes chrysocephalus]|uniref:tRNA (guanine(37)-N1)-methyltransferase n=1 Tax=Psylliodes chrysocephalus TaxID=3402493 RepID=A0A9P0D8M4_9CUCU|nr:unnamed protein product [Psylliodes chrysocephala]